MIKTHHLSSVCLLLALSGHANADNVLSQKQFLYEKLLINELNYQDNLVEQTLKRLELIAPNDPIVIAAAIRLAVRQGNIPLAKEWLAKLKASSPDYQLYRQAKTNITLALPENQEKLAQARLFTVNGNLEEAYKRYDELFHGEPPTPELSVEYWKLLSAMPEKEELAFQELNNLYTYLSSNHLIINTAEGNNWQGTLLKTLSNLSELRGQRAFKQMQLPSATRYFNDAIKFNPNNDNAYIGLADTAFLQKNYAAAETYYKKIELKNWNGYAIYGLVRIYKRESIKRALDYLYHLPADAQTRFKTVIEDLEHKRLEEEGDAFYDQKNWAQAVIKYRQAQQFDPLNIWLTHHLADALHEIGQTNKGKQLFNQLVIKLPTSPEAAFSYALFLSGINEDKAALNRLNTIPTSHWDKQMQALYERLRMELALTDSQALWDKGQKKEAIRMLKALPENSRITLRLGKWALEETQFSEALRYFKIALRADPTNIDAILGEIETYIAQGEVAKAQTQLVQNTPTLSSKNLVIQRRFADAWNNIARPDYALTIYNRIKQTAKNLAPSEDNAVLFRNTARIERQFHQPIAAKIDYTEAMYQSEITPIRPTNNNTYTRLTRLTSGDNWIKRSIRQDAAALYQAQQTSVTIGNDFWKLPGTPAYSGFNANESTIQIDTPVFNGRGSFRANYIRTSAGQFSTINGSYIAPFGTCTVGCTSGIIQRQTGYGFDADWHNEKWNVNLGHTPIGFPLSNWFGGLGYSGEFRHIGWTLSGRRSIMNNSLLSFGGAVDPNTQIKWGAAMFNGLNLSLNYDRGLSYGLWGNLDAGTVTGKNIPINQRIRLMDGYYYKLINEDHRQFSIGINSMLWHYQKNLGGYTLGQGGYYSPQRFLSVGLPLDYRQRTENWTYQVGGSVAWTTASTKANYLYPLPQLIPGFVAADNTLSTSAGNTGLAYAFYALAERRLTAHLVLGGMIDIQRSRDYTPSHAAIYLRYFFDAWEGDMDLPIRPRYTMYNNG